MSAWRDPTSWPLPKRHRPSGHCSMDGHSAEGKEWMTRRYGEVSGEYIELRICPVHDGDAADVTKIHRDYGRKRCVNRQCPARWEHQGKCP